MADVQKRYVKLTLVSPDDADVLAIVNRLAHCGRLAQTVVAALRAYYAAAQGQGVAIDVPLVATDAQAVGEPVPVDESVFSFG